MKKKNKKKIDSIIKFILYPNIRWVYTCFFVGIFFMLVSHIGMDRLEWRIGSDIFMFYSTVIFCFSIPQVVSEIFNLLNRNKYISLFLNDVNVRMFVTLYMNLIITSVYAFLNLFSGIENGSHWQIAIALYYIILTLTRFYLLTYVNRMEGGIQKTKGAELLLDFEKYQMTGWFLMVLCIPIVWILVQMLEENASYQYSGFMLFVMFAFNIYLWVLTIYGHMMYRKIDAPILTSTRAIAFAGALMSLLAFETAWLSEYPIHSDLISRELVVSFTGFFALLIIGSMGIHMIKRAHSILSLNKLPRKYRNKVTLKERRRIMKENYAKEKARYEEYMKENWENGAL